MNNEKALVLRTCAHDMTAHGGFQWPESGMVECPDWSPVEECGSGLHGWLYGQGDHSCSSYLDYKAKWLVVEVELAQVVMLGGKCKFPKGIVRFVGSRKDATDYLRANEPRAREVAVIGATIAVGDKESAVVGALGTATAGYEGTATAGDCGTATAGYGGTATAGDCGTATAGYCGTATAGDSGTATAGNWGTATAGYGGTATAGYGGTATAGNEGTATAGEKGEIRIRYWDDKAERYRTKVGYIGEDKLMPGVAYKLNDEHAFVEAE